MSDNTKKVINTIETNDELKKKTFVPYFLKLGKAKKKRKIADTEKLIAESQTNAKEAASSSTSQSTDNNVRNPFTIKKEKNRIKKNTRKVDADLSDMSIDERRQGR